MLTVPPLTVCTGRIRTFIESPEKQTMAPSCTLYVYDNDLEDAMLFVDRALRGGAGVKVQLEKFKPRLRARFNWAFYLHHGHPDYHLIEKDDTVSSLFFDAKLRQPTWIHVADSMEQNDGYHLSIRNSWLRFIELAADGKDIVVDLTALRPAGTTNSVGLVATGPLGYGDGDGSFLSVYQRLATHLRQGDIISLMQLLGQLNRVLRRGGTYKNGIVTNALHYKHPDIYTYLTTPLPDLPGGQKRGIRVARELLKDESLCRLIVDGLNQGGLFLEKINQDPTLYSQVCVEILLKHRGVCLLSHANAAACNSPKELVDALVSTTIFLTELHLTWRQDIGNKADIYLPLKDDRQIGVGWCGWANFLRRMGVTYRQHVESLEAYLECKPYHDSKMASEITECLVAAYYSATLACSTKMTDAGYQPLDRIFTMAPCQRNWVDYTDPDGFALCRSIDPPFNRHEFRDSHTDTASVGRYDHGPVETMSDVGHDLHQRHWEAWQELMNMQNKAHTMSFDLWKKVDTQWLWNFIEFSPLQTTYYQFADKLDQQYLNKGCLLEAVDYEAEEGCSTCGE